jgi:hypothetical protein
LKRGRKRKFDYGLPEERPENENKSFRRGDDFFPGGEPPNSFECFHCNEVFKVKAALEKHIEKFHSGEVPEPRREEATNPNFEKTLSHLDHITKELQNIFDFNE